MLIGGMIIQFKINKEENVVEDEYSLYKKI